MNPFNSDNKGERSINIIIFTGLLGLSILPLVAATSQVYGVQVFSEKDVPLGISYDSWISKWWNWWVSTNNDEANPDKQQCLINSTDSAIMLMDTAVGGSQQQSCNISSEQAILIPLWTGWCDETATGHENDSYEQLTKCAREEVNSGKVISRVSIDGVDMANLDVDAASTSGSFVVSKNLKSNVTEIYSKGFNITLPEDTHFPDQAAFGTFRAGAHGWFVFLRPLDPGNHTIFYTIHVEQPGMDVVNSEITYAMNVQ